MKKLKTLIKLFFTLAKIGLFTFGGGYAMISIIEREIIEKKKWLDKNEFLDILAIAESSPGPAVVNTATFVGYKLCGFLGSLFATLGVILPSFIVIVLISLFFEKFVALEYVAYAFRGIQVCVAYLIMSAGVKLLKALDKSAFNITMILLTCVVFIVLTFFAVDFSSIYFIIVGAIIGLDCFLIKYFKQKKSSYKKDKEDKND